MIKIICVGKLKDFYFSSAVKEYEKRLSRYTKLQLIEVADQSYSDISKIKEVEGQEILNHIHPKDYVITLEVEGRSFDSLAFANALENLEMQYGSICFVIGGSYGLAKSVLQRSQLSFSFSKMTFPHTLFRVMFLEQLYRAYKIRKNENYHK